MALRAANGLLDGVTALLVLLAVVWSGYALWDNSRVYAAADNVQAGLLAFKPQPQEDNSLSFIQLRDINPDVCGWLTLDGTAIDYPVVQGESNFTYLNTDVYGSFALAGSIFLDVDCDADFSGRYSLVYGSLASLVILLVWLYICGNILLLGAVAGRVWGQLHAPSGGD